MITISDYIPTFLNNLRRKKRIKKIFGNQILTHTIDISDSAILGKKVRLGFGVSIRENVKLGDYSYCSNGTIIFKGSQIGKFCSIGYNVQIGCPEHPLNFFSTSPAVYRDSKIKKYCEWPMDDIVNPVIIDNDVWIGSNSIILQGVHIGNGAIVAAGAVVTKDIPPFTVWGGSQLSSLGRDLIQMKKRLLRIANGGIRIWKAFL